MKENRQKTQKNSLEDYTPEELDNMSIKDGMLLSGSSEEEIDNIISNISDLAKVFEKLSEIIEKNPDYAALSIARPSEICNDPELKRLFSNVIEEAILAKEISDNSFLSERNREKKENLFQPVAPIPKNHIMQISALANNLTKGIINIEGKAAIEKIKVFNGNGKQPPVYTSCLLEYSGDNVQLFSQQPYTEYDRAVSDTVTSLFANDTRCFTPSMVYRAMVNMTGGEEPSAAQKGAVTKSLDKQRFVRVRIDATQEFEHRKKKDGLLYNSGNDLMAIDRDMESVKDALGIPVKADIKAVKTQKDGYLLPLKATKLKIQFKDTDGKIKVKEIPGYEFIDTPPLYEYASETGQLATVPADLLDIHKIDGKGNIGERISNNERRISIKNYLLRRIAVMKGPATISNHILIDTLMEEIGEKNATEKILRSVKDYAEQVLKYYAFKKFIKVARAIKKGKTVTGYEIIY